VCGDFSPHGVHTNPITSMPPCSTHSYIWLGLEVLEVLEISGGLEIGHCLILARFVSVSCFRAGGQWNEAYAFSISNATSYIVKKIKG
jgi:hypothetical protein